MATSSATNLTLKQRRKLQGVAMPEEGSASSGPKELSRKVATLVFLLAFGLGAILGMLFFRTDPRLQELDQIARLEEFAGPDMSGDVRDMLRGDSDDINNQLPTSERRRTMEDYMFSRMAGFFKLPTADQLAQLKRRAEREIERDQAMQQLASDPNANADAKNGNNNGNGRHGGGSDQQRAARMEKMLANRPPEQRSQFTLMHQMSTAVKQQMTR